MKAVARILIMLMICFNIISCEGDNEPDITSLLYKNLELHPYKLNYIEACDYEAMLPKQPEIVTILDGDNLVLMLSNIKVYDNNQLVADLYYDSPEVEFFMAEDYSSYYFKTEFGVFTGYNNKIIECDFTELPSHIKTDRKIKIKASTLNKVAYITFIQTGK